MLTRAQAAAEVMSFFKELHADGFAGPMELLFLSETETEMGGVNESWVVAKTYRHAYVYSESAGKESPMVGRVSATKQLKAATVGDDYAPPGNAWESCRLRHRGTEYEIKAVNAGEVDDFLLLFDIELIQ